MNINQLSKYVDLREKLPRNKKYNSTNIKNKTHIVIHHSLTLSGSAESYNDYHLNTKGWDGGIGYQFVIEKNGDLKHCQDINAISYHVGNHNKYCLGICLTGDFRTQKPTEEQIETLRNLVNHLIKFELPNYKATVGHSELKGYEWKQCPVFDFRKALSEKKVEVKPIPKPTIKKPIVKPSKPALILPNSILRNGDKGEEVKRLQQALNTLKFNCGVVDGIFGKGTESALKKFQSTYKLVADGIYGPNTRKKISEVYNK